MLVNSRAWTTQDVFYCSDFPIPSLLQPLCLFQACMHNTKLIQNWKNVLEIIDIDFDLHWKTPFSIYAIRVLFFSELRDWSQWWLLFAAGVVVCRRTGKRLCVRKQEEEWGRKEKSILRTIFRERRILRSKLKNITCCASNNISTEMIVKWNGTRHHIVSVSPSCCMKICGQVINKQMVLPSTPVCITTLSLSFFFFAELQVSLMKTEDSETYFSSGSCL